MEKRKLVAAACLLAVCVCARGDYTLSPRVNGLDSVRVAVNGLRTFTIDVVLSSDSPGEDSHTSAVFCLAFSRPGLQCDGCQWSAPYVREGGDDFTFPSGPYMPALMSASTWIDPMDDAGEVDMYFENFIAAEGQSFSTGVLAGIDVSVLEGLPLGPLTVTAVPCTLDNGYGAVPTTGGSLTLNVVLEGDTSGDAFVGQADLDIVLSSWGQHVPPGDRRADLNGDNFIGQADLDAVLSHWGQSAMP
jgi:hypothetical protein